MTTCQDEPKGQTPIEVLQELIEHCTEEYFLSKFADYYKRQAAIAEDEFVDGRLPTNHVVALAAHLFEAGLELGGLFYAFGVRTKIGDSVRDGDLDTLFDHDPDMPMRSLVNGDPPHWMDESFESPIVKAVIEAMQKSLGLLDDKQFYWCGWTVPDDVPDEHMVESWPTNMKGWHTGSGEGFTTWAGLVWASSPDEAWRTVLSCYGPSADQIGERWEPEERGTEWEGTGRFPATQEQIEKLKGGV